MDPLRRVGRFAGRAVISACVVVSAFSLAENVNQSKWQRRDEGLDDEGEAAAAKQSLVPDRGAMLGRLRSGEQLDVLIIGGGATGAGAALDAAARGLKVACVEREDFSSGTSSRSTKLIWAGSRYLVNAFISLFHSDLRLLRDPVKTVEKFLSEVRMVQNCHRERRFLLETQPHLTHWVPIAVPFSSWVMWPPPFGFSPAALGPLGLFPAFFKLYDAMGGFCSPPSHIMTSKRADRKYPMLSQQIKYCSIFYEGMHDDARTNLAVALTAARHGAVMTNYCNVVGFVTAGQEYDSKSGGRGGYFGWFVSAPKKPALDSDFNPDRVVGAVLRDELTGETFTVRAKSIALCGGPFTDELRKLEHAAVERNSSGSGDSQELKKAIRGATGIHIVLPSYYAPEGMGLVDMNTSDGRFLFLLPWQGHVLVGTTDSPCPNIDMRPIPEEQQIQWLLNECSKYLSPELQVRRQDVLSAWSGIRPLATDPHAKDTASVSRDHVISVNERTGVVFISGGKWTTYREMAQDLVDKLLAVTPSLLGNVGAQADAADREIEQAQSAVKIQPCSTLDIALHGKQGFSTNLPIRLSQEFGLSKSVAQQLATRYGGNARQVCVLARDEKGPPHMADLGQPLVPGHGYLRAEVVYAARNEWALRAEDVVARRLRLAFVNKSDAQRAVRPIVDLMAKELKWNAARCQREVELCETFLEHFGGPVERGQ